MNPKLSARGLRVLCVLALASSQLGACSSSNLMEEDGSDTAGSSSAGFSNAAGASNRAGASNAGSPSEAGAPSDEGGAAGKAGAGGSSAGTSGGGAANAGMSGGGAANGGGGAANGGGGAANGGGGAANGGTGGSVGGAGSGGGSTCGNGTLDAGEVCDSKFSANDCGGDCKAITSATCFACENTDATCKEFVSCEAVAGMAAAGSPAAGVARKSLCNEVLDCVRDTKCAGPEDSEISKCYCGTANPEDCQAGKGNGPCKTQLDRGLETTVFATIAQRIGNTTYGGGMAMSRFDCDQSFCPVECF